VAWSKPDVTPHCHTDIGPAVRLAVKHATDAFVNQEAVDRQWQALNYAGVPNFARAIDEYDRFASLLRDCGAALEFLPPHETVGLDSIYVRDGSVVCDRGVILCNMGKAARRSEPAAQQRFFESIGVPIHGAITGEGRLEGGDVTWIDDRTLAVGRGYRTNDEGIRQLRALVDGCVDELLVVPLPHYRGPADVFHLMSIISPIDRDLMLVYSPLMPVPFREALVAREVQLVEVCEDEFETMGCNVLAVAPRTCVMLSGNPETRARLERAGATVHEFDGREISAKGAGGPTCLTRPLPPLPTT
jgi:N-dimethylarginine dimethylaminohydrolase